MERGGGELGAEGVGEDVVDEVDETCSGAGLVIMKGAWGVTGSEFEMVTGALSQVEIVETGVGTGEGGEIGGGGKGGTRGGGREVRMSLRTATSASKSLTLSNRGCPVCKNRQLTPKTHVEQFQKRQREGLCQE